MFTLRLDAILTGESHCKLAEKSTAGASTGRKEICTSFTLRRLHS